MPPATQNARNNGGEIVATAHAQRGALSAATLSLIAIILFFITLASVITDRLAKRQPDVPFRDHLHKGALLTRYARLSRQYFAYIGCPENRLRYFGK